MLGSVAGTAAVATPADGPEAETAETADRVLADLFGTEAVSLVRMARFFVQDRAAAEDLVQEAFIRLSRHLHRLDGRAARVAYVRAIVLNLCRDHNRRGLMSLRHQPPADLGPDLPEDVVTGREQSREVVAALAALPRRQRDCLVLRYYLELSPPDIATTLGLSPNSVKTHLRRGLRALEDALAGARGASGTGRTR
ncbi:RNA polymerase sigma factor [Aquipuribacter sp. SD81]|uniref:RNA polymerase sigma factor n=1 Tax=Aquipuribacter sp. SD81 TaxID=3127703 RepID=UPI00301B5F15